MRVYYNPKLKEKAKKLRKHGTFSEVLLWNRIKRDQLGYDFHRQKPIDNYIVDFFCAKLKLIIEVDGESHNFKTEDDLKKQKKLESLGLEILRFRDVDVKQNIEGVILSIKEWIDLHTP